ncbi:hypothetical protein ABPG75_002941 [Micractinium tetrahymenae]
MGCCFSEPQVVRTTYTSVAAGDPAPGYPAAGSYPHCPPAAGYPAASGYYPASGPSYYPQQPQQVVYVQEQRSSGIGAGGAAALGAGAGFLGGVLLADAMRPDHYAYGGTTIIDNSTTVIEAGPAYGDTVVVDNGGFGGFGGGNTVIVDNGSWGGGDVIVGNGGWGGDTVYVDDGW